MAAATDNLSTFRPVLIIVDFQEDFCPPNGSLAVAEGRDIAPVINAMLSYPALATRVATQDWHPADHISFAANHQGKKPFEDVALVTNPSNASETYETRLWPVHCVQDTPGAALVPELDVARIDHVVKKGRNPFVEMYSAFYDPLQHPRVSDSGLAALLRDRGVTHVYVVGLAADYCVKSTALDAAAEGFETVIVEEATRAVDPAGWATVRAEIEARGVAVVAFDGPEVARLREAPVPMAH